MVNSVIYSVVNKENISSMVVSVYRQWEYAVPYTLKELYCTNTINYWLTPVYYTKWPCCIDWSQFTRLARCERATEVFYSELKWPGGSMWHRNVIVSSVHSKSNTALLLNLIARWLHSMLPVVGLLTFYLKVFLFTKVTKDAYVFWCCLQPITNTRPRRKSWNQFCVLS